MSRHIDFESIAARSSPEMAWESRADKSARRAGVPWMRARRGDGRMRALVALPAARGSRELVSLSVMINERRSAVEFTAAATGRAAGSRFVEADAPLLDH
jgi:hypothetical protein